MSFHMDLTKLRDKIVKTPISDNYRHPSIYYIKAYNVNNRKNKLVGTKFDTKIAIDRHIL